MSQFCSQSGQSGNQKEKEYWRINDIMYFQAFYSIEVVP